MFNGKKLDNINERLELLTELVISIQEENRGLLLTINNNTLKLMPEVIQNRKTYQEVVKGKKKIRRPNMTNQKGFTKVSEKEKAEILRLYEQGLSITEIALSTGRSGGTVSNHLRSMIATPE